MRKILLPIIATLTLLAIQSCTEDGIGMSLMTTRSEVVCDSSFSITGQTVENNSLPARTITQLLGVISAENYGTMRTDFVSQMMPAWPIDTNYISESGIDSCCFVFRIPIGGYTGDSVTPMRATVYRLTRPLPRPISSSFDPTGYYDNANPLGSASYTATALQSDHLADSLDDLGYREIKVNVDRSLAVDLYRKFKETPDLFRDPASFETYFPGIYVTTSFGNGRVMNIYNTEFKVYCRRVYDTEELDTVIGLDRSYMASTEEVLTNNNIRLDISDKVKDMIANGDAIIQTPAAYDVQLTLPVQEILNRFLNDADAQTVFNNVTLEIPAIELVNDRGIAPPEDLLLIPANKKQEFLSSTNVPDEVTSFHAQYDTSKKCYTFSLREYFVKLMDEKNGIADDEDCIFSLTPIDVITESSSSSSSYNYNNYIYYMMYGYYPMYNSQSSATIIEVVPAMQRPTIVKLDLGKANLSLMYSRLFENN